MTRASSKRPEPTDSGGRLSPTNRQRCRELERLWIEGWPPARLRRHCREQWGLADRTSRRLLAHVRESVTSDWEVERRELLAEALERLSETYHRALASNSLAVALGALNSIARLAGLDPDPGAMARRAVVEAMAGVGEAITAANLPPDAALSLRLRLAAKGLGAMPSLETLPDEQLDAIAAGELTPQAGAIEARAVEVD